MSEAVSEEVVRETDRQPQLVQLFLQCVTDHMPNGWILGLLAAEVLYKRNYVGSKECHKLGLK